VVLAEKTIPRQGKHFFSIYEMLLGDSAQVKWSQIVETQVVATPWTDLKGNLQNPARKHSVESFRDCVKFHLLSVFSHNAAEQQKYYIIHNIRKTRKIPIRNFADRIEKLNSYILLLP
jgi:hypothetical protein